jgi:serine O-acetyltransferase
MQETRSSVARLSDGISAEVEDWSRERCGRFEWHPSRQLLRALRDHARAVQAGGPLGALRAKLAVLRHRFWSVVSGADVPLGCRIAGGLLLPHPNGVVIHPKAVVGPNCTLFQQVTVGEGPKPGLPCLGGHVDVGPGAKILGGVTIGDHAAVGANAVVLSDVGRAVAVVGVPATPMRRQPSDEVAR